MSSAVPEPSLYEQLEALPRNLVGEILGGHLYAHPRPAPRHLRAMTRLSSILDTDFGEADGKFGGWQILIEPEIHFLRKVEVDVPDLAGWRRERMPHLPETAFFEMVPDWVCEVLSPRTARLDRTVKMPIYARTGVSYAWLVDPIARSLEAYRLGDGAWLPIGHFSEADTVTTAPFEVLAFELDRLWA